jgi:general stress protein YciG
MATQRSGTNHPKDDKTRQPQQGSHPDQQGEDEDKDGGSSHREDNPGNFANDPDRARNPGHKGGQS